MAGAPQLKIYDKNGEYLAACKRAEEAAALMAFLGDGSSVRNGHQKSHTVWIEGKEKKSASESYDFVAQIVYERMADSNYCDV